MAQNRLWGQQAELLVEDAPHVFVGRDEPLHEHISLTFAYHLHCDLNALDIIRFGDDRQLAHVDTLGFAHLLYLCGVAYDSGVDQACHYRVIYRFECVRILPVSHYKPLFSFRFCFEDYVLQMFDHDFI